MPIPPSHDTPEQWHAARVSAARAVVKIREKLGKPIDPEVAALAADLPRADLRRAERRAS